ncbi:potassium transporter Kup [Dongia sp.]|uniref:potassium transporter Kup n=1 Tax=Dongia sp. TaxID=1977262 RepID=UPI0035AF9548
MQTPDSQGPATAPSTDHTPHGALAPLAIGALGVVFGDIGTSPIYTFREAFHGAGEATANPAHVFGILSLIFWMVMIVVSFKYALLILRADNQGQGGLLALIGLAIQSATKSGRREKFLALGIVGAALFYGDGMITPAISILSAVEGIEVAEPEMARWVVPITIVIVIGLFAVQSRGTGAVGALFGPIVMIWFTTLGVLGITQIVQHPDILLALSPHYALSFLFHNIGIAFPVMGAVLLAVTGAEALYADLGHFGRKPIQASWFFFVLPCLMLNYFGQGALVLVHPDAVINPFYLMAPDWFLYPLIGLATLATIIASQAVISGAFSLSWQAMRMGVCPRLLITHTSARHQGQIYVPQINWLLMICVLLLVVGFQSSSGLANAYGIAVTGTMIIDTIIAFFVFRALWKWSPLRTILICGFILLVEASLLSASMLKVLDGGWFPLLIGAIIIFILSTWMDGRGLLAKRHGAGSLTEDEFLGALSERHLSRVPGTALFLTAQIDRVPFALLHNMRHNRILHERIVMTTLITEARPFVPDSERIQVRELGRGFWRIIVHYGFADEPDLPAAMRMAAKHGLDMDPESVSYFIGRERIVPRAKSAMSGWRRWLFILLSDTEISASDYFRIPVGRIIELGARTEI